MLQLGLALIFSFGAIFTSADSLFDQYLRKAYFLKDHSRFEEAILVLDSAIAVNPNSGQSLVLRAFCNYSMGNFGQAIEDCNQALVHNPKDDYAYLLRAFSHSQQDIFPAQQQTLFHPDSIYKDGYTQRLESRYRVKYTEQGVRIYDYAAAISDLNNAISYNDRCAACRHTRARLQKTLGNYAAAMEDMNRLIAQEPENANYYVERALLHQAIGEYRMAYFDLTTATEQAPNDPTHYLNRAVLRYEHLNDVDGACRDFLQARRLGAKEGIPPYAADCP